MARTALIVKTQRRLEASDKAHSAGRKAKHPTRVYHRCEKCGKNGSYMRKFAICRICFRELASQGKIMGVKKSSW